MATINEMLQRLNALNVEDIVNSIIEEDSFMLSEIQKEQIWAGLDNKGNQLTPSYFADPFFKTAEAARRYSDWKDRITPAGSTAGIYPARRKGTPNLFINGYYYSGIVFSPSNGGYFYNKSSISSEVGSKYPNLYGINSIGRAYYIKKSFRKKLTGSIKTKLKV